MEDLGEDFGDVSSDIILLCRFQWGLDCQIRCLGCMGSGIEAQGTERSLWFKLWLLGSVGATRFQVSIEALSRL